MSVYSFHFGCGAVSWSSKKQYIIASSSMEATYIIQTHAAMEALWMWSFVDKVRRTGRVTIMINCDNQWAISLAKNNKCQSRTKHIDLCYHFIQEAVEDGKITVSYVPMVPTYKNVLDTLTTLVATILCHTV